MSDKKVRVRFAPSPTGPLHIGGVRTALYNYLFAKKHGGDFLLRIEDTDQTRYVEGAEDYILESLKWCGLNTDEDVVKGGPYAPYRQSERKAMYKQYAEQLINEGWAYYAFDTPGDLDKIRKEYEAEKKNFAYDIHTRKTLKNSLILSTDEVNNLIQQGEPYVVRFKMPENEDVIINDIIRGEVKFNTSVLDDKVLFKSDGLPTYHLANVVDDYLMKISHVIRGEEWLPSLPLHALLYKALGWETERPQFAHLPLILKPTGKGKLSKRDGDQMGFPVFPLEWKSSEGEIASGYRESGYFADAFINMLALLGWNSGTDQELFSMEELINAFSLERVGKSGARFDPEKTKWFNNQYLQKKSNEEVAKLFEENELKARGVDSSKFDILKIVSLVKERANFVSELWDQSYYFFQTPEEYDAKTVKKRWKENTPDIVNKVIELLEAIDDFSSEKAEQVTKAYIEQEELPMGQVMNALRLAIVGAGMGPHLFDIMDLIGKEETIQRLKKAVEELSVS